MMGLTACQLREPTPEEVAIQKACEQGNVNACAFLVEQQERRRQATAQALQNLSYQPPVRRTNCTTFGNQINCNTF